MQTIEEIRGAVSRGWCHPTNSAKVMDGDLAEAISQEVAKQLMWPDPTEEMLNTPEFEAIWGCIKSWDINVPGAYGGYCGATGNHVRAILDALRRVKV